MVHIKRFSVALSVVAVWLLLGLLALYPLGLSVIWLGLGLLAGVILLDIHIRQLIRDSQRHSRPHRV